MHTHITHNNEQMMSNILHFLFALVRISTTTYKVLD